MKISSHYVNASLKPYNTRVDSRDTMNYAASISDDNPSYFQDDDPGGIIAHPLHCVVVTWPILEKIQDFLELDDFPTEILATQVHYTEQLIIHRLLVPGDQLTINGRVAAILPHRAGTHIITRLEAFDREGSPVFTEYMGGLMRGVQCTDAGKGEESIPTIPLMKNEQFPSESSIPINPLLPFIYDGCSRIHFPIHTSRQFAHFVGLPGIILQGTATLALAVREIVNAEAGGNPRRLQSISCRFTGMVKPGTAIRLQTTARDQDNNVFFKMINHEGRTAISHGHVKLAPGEC